MRALVTAPLAESTFGVSYTGNISWGGMEKYIRDLHVYAGENNHSKSLVVEVFTLGDNFSICVMQPGKYPIFVKNLIQSFADCGIECRLMSETRFHLADYEIS